MVTDIVDRSAWRGVGGVRKFLVPKRKAVDEAARTIEFVVSTAARDRDGDIIEPGGWRTEQYMRNPVVLWAHDAGQPPVAKALSVEVRDGALMAVAQFTDAETYAFGDTVFRLYAGGYLNAVSAGFMPISAEPFEDGGVRGYRISDQELWEFSAVPVPANPEALVSAKSAKVNMRPYEQWLEKSLDEGAAPDFRKELSAQYIRLTGSVHSAVQAETRKRNEKALEAARAKENAVNEDQTPEAKMDDLPPDAGPADDGETSGEVFTTGEGGEPLHTHEFTAGDTQTTEAGDPPHVHAVIVGEDGVVTIGDTDGHTHEAPPQAVVEPDVAPELPGDPTPAVEAAAPEAQAKAGRVLSKGNAELLRAARDAIDAVLVAAEREDAVDKSPAPRADVVKIVEARPDTVKLTPEIVGKLGEMVARAVETEFRRAAGRVR